MAEPTALEARELSELLRGADTVLEIQLAEDHPFYPVFWDFAFVVTHGTDAAVVIGSSSD